MADNRVYIDGVQLPPMAHDGLKISRNKVWSGNTGRVATGEMTGDLVDIKAKLECSWPVLTEQQVALIDGLVSRPFFNVTYTDPATNARRTRKFYAGDITYPVYSYNENLPRYTNIQVSLIEK